MLKTREILSEKNYLNDFCFDSSTFVNTEWMTLFNSEYTELSIFVRGHEYGW